MRRRIVCLLHVRLLCTCYLASDGVRSNVCPWYNDHHHTQESAAVGTREKCHVKKSVLLSRIVINVLSFSFPELCMMTGLTDSMRSDFRLMQAVANITRISPQARVDRTYQFLDRIKGNPEVCYFFSWRKFHTVLLSCGNSIGL